MKLNLNLKRKLQRFCLILICLVVFICQSDIPNLKALPMDNYQGKIVIEELRLKVPASVKAAWLNAEKEIWEPWLSSQVGFLGRQLFWDKEKEEALILVNWKSKNEKLYYSGLQIVSKNIFNNRKKIFPMNEVWKKLIKNNQIKGYLISSKIRHIGDKKSILEN